MDTDKQLTDILVAGFNRRVDEVKSKIRTLHNQINELPRKEQEIIEMYNSKAEDVQELRRRLSEVYTPENRDYYTRGEVERERRRLTDATNELNDLRHRHSQIGSRHNELNRELDLLEREHDSFLRYSTDDKKAEAYYSWLLEDMQKAKSEEDYATLVKKFSDISGYKDCAALADRCKELKEQQVKETDYNRLLKDMKEAKSEGSYALLAKKFSDMRGYKDCAELANQCNIRIEELRAACYNRLLEDMKKAKSEEDYAALAKKFSDMRGYKDCAVLADKCLELRKEKHIEAEKQVALKTVKFENLKSTFRWSKLILGLLTAALTAFAMYKVHFLLTGGLLVWLVFAIVKGLVKNNPQFKEISTVYSITVRYNKLQDNITALQGAIKKFYQWFAPLLVIGIIVFCYLAFSSFFNFSFGPDPVKDAKKALVAYCDCNTKYNEERIKVYEEFVESFNGYSFKNKQEARNKLKELQTPVNTEDSICQSTAAQKYAKLSSRNGYYSWCGDGMTGNLYEFESVYDSIAEMYIPSNQGTLHSLYTEVENKIVSIYDPDNKEQGVVINGITWATRNVGKSGTFIAKPENIGKSYKWNNGKRTNHNTGDIWETANDPSPAGWRVPTLGEMESLVNKVYVTSKWTIQNGVEGRLFTDKGTGASIFLPADNGYCSYWSNENGGGYCDEDSYAFTLNFGKDGVSNLRHEYGTLCNTDNPIRPVIKE